jgi:hypothetical protein
VQADARPGQVVLPVHEEMASLHRRIEQLQDEQRQLLLRFDELTASTAQRMAVG